jgi:hypothetical protein
MRRASQPLHRSGLSLHCSGLKAQTPRQQPTLRRLPPRRGFEVYWETFFLACFTLELLIKLLALGLKRYFVDPWNWLDFVVVVNGIISQVLTATGTGGAGAVSVLRLFRILRPLRALKRVRGMRVIVDTIIGSLPQICRVFMVLVLSCLILGIVGVQLFSANLRHQCWTPTGDGGWAETGYRCRPLCFDAIDFETQAFKPGKNNSDCLSLGENTLRRGLGFGGDALSFWTCAEHSEQQCLCGGNPIADAFCSFTDNPNYGANGFDNILQVCPPAPPIPPSHTPLPSLLSTPSLLPLPPGHGDRLPDDNDGGMGRHSV